MSFANLMSALISDIDEISAEMVGGRINPSTFQRLMGEALFEHHVAAYMLGDNVRELSQGAKDKLSEIIGEQIDYLDAFADTIERDGWRDAMAARARLYAGSIKTSYSAGKTNLLPLPGYPAQGTQCVTNCKCEWEIRTINAQREDYDCYWRRAADDSCETCIGRERRWQPYRIRFGEGEEARAA